MEGIAGQFVDGRLDGMIDTKNGLKHWLLPDSATAVASKPGAEGSRSVLPAEWDWSRTRVLGLSTSAPTSFCTPSAPPLPPLDACWTAWRQGLHIGLLEIGTGYDGSGHIAARDYTADAGLWEREARNQMNYFTGGVSGIGRFTQAGVNGAPRFVNGD